MRIAKRIARSGRCSRREAERLIASGVVQLNGVIVTSPAINVTLKDRIVVDGEVLSPIQRTRVVLANKLKGELVTTNDEKGFSPVAVSCVGRNTVFNRLRKTGLDCHIMPVVCLARLTE